MNIPHTPGEIVYPDSDGKPMSDNSLQFRWIQVLTSNLAALVRGRDDVFVGGDLLWYPVQGFNKIRQAPDALVVFGRPDVYRGSYKQWEEDDVPMTVVFEVLSPNNSPAEMEEKFEFYQEYGAEEYYVLDPEANTLEAYRRRADLFAPQRFRKKSYVSPRLGIRFDLGGGEVAVFYPDGRPFVTLAESVAERENLGQRLQRLGELSRLARRGQATAEQLAELDRLEDEAAAPP